jgi:hypothetical protein
MPVIRIYNNGYIFDSARVANFVQQIDELICKIESLDLEVDVEIINFKGKVLKEKNYCNKDVFFIEDLYDKLYKCINTYSNDLPF